MLEGRVRGGRSGVGWDGEGHGGKEMHVQEVMAQRPQFFLLSSSPEGAEQRLLGGKPL